MDSPIDISAPSFAQEVLRDTNPVYRMDVWRDRVIMTAFWQVIANHMAHKEGQSK